MASTRLALGVVVVIACGPAAPGQGTEETVSDDSSAADTVPTATLPTGEPPAATPVLQLHFGPIKQFDFSWEAVDGADRYQIYERVTVDEEYRQLGEDIAGVSMSWTMPLHLRFGASYVLRACNDGACTDSEPVDVNDSLASAVGYFKSASPDSFDHFGHAIALSADGDTLVVGTEAEDGASGDPHDDSAEDAGAVYVYARVGGTWSQQAYLKPSNAAPGDTFGCDLAVSADGNTLVVGAPDESSAATGIDGDQTDDSAAGSGAVYMFVRAAGVWSQRAYIKASNTGPDDEFGSAVALSADGRTLAVGAYREDSAATGIDGDQTDESANFAGAVYTFTRAGDSWLQRAYLKSPTTRQGDGFGVAVALAADGTTLAVSAPGEDSASAGVGGDPSDDSVESSGAVYVYVKAGESWTQQAYVKAINPGESDYFGHRVALSASGDTLAVNADGEDSSATGIDGDPFDDSVEGAGAVYVYARANGVWSHQAYLKAPATGIFDFFGQGIALSDDGDILAVGANREASAAVGVGGDPTDNSVEAAGAAYMFVRTGEVWSPRSYVKPPNTAYDQGFGFDIALSADGTTLAVTGVGEGGGDAGVGGDPADQSVPSSGAVFLY